jgi:hypothetical protein
MRTNQKDLRYKDIGIKKCCANQVEIKQKVFFLKFGANQIEKPCHE